MNMILKNFFTLACYLLLIACGGGDSDNKSPPPQPEPNTPMAEFKLKVDRWITEEIKDIERFGCQNTSNNSPECELETVKFSQGHFDSSKSDPNQTLLVLDTALEFPAVVRYRSRIKAAFGQMDDGYYQNDIAQYDPAFNIPVFVKNTLRKIDNFTQDNNISDATIVPALWLERLSPVMDTAYPYDSYSPYIGHGTQPLLYLLEYNPEAEFVIAPAPRFFEKLSHLFCQPNIIESGQSVSNLERLQTRIENASQHFYENIIEGQDIEYINYSGGVTLETVTTKWQALCSSPLPDPTTQRALLNTLKPFFNRLFNSEGVMGVQATDINMTAINNPFDIDSNHRNQVTVGDYTTLDSKLPIDGIIGNQTPPSLLANRQNSIQWIDILINFGIVPQRPFPFNETPLMSISALGLSSLPITNVQPSWAAPVALSRAIFVKNSEGFKNNAMDDTLIDIIRNKMTPIGCDYDEQQLCKIQDPLLWRQQEIFRLRYLD